MRSVDDTFLAINHVLAQAPPESVSRVYMIEGLSSEFDRGDNIFEIRGGGFERTELKRFLVQDSQVEKNLST